jgi:hypothetical protein
MASPLTLRFKESEIEESSIVKKEYTIDMRLKSKLEVKKLCMNTVVFVFVDTLYLTLNSNEPYVTNAKILKAYSSSLCPD